METGGTWQEWVVVGGYLSFILFIMWRVVVASSKQ